MVGGQKDAVKHGVNGWQIGDGYEGPGQDEHDRKCLYRVLQEEVMLTYYNNRPGVQMMRASIDMAHWNFSSQRMVPGL